MSKCMTLVPIDLDQPPRPCVLCGGRPRLAGVFVPRAADQPPRPEGRPWSFHFPLCQRCGRVRRRAAALRRIKAIALRCRPGGEALN